MAGERCRKRMLEESTCSICLDFFRDPMMLSCGHNFCKACITRCWEEAASPQCPQCRQCVQKRLRPNRQLASLIQIGQELRQGEEAGLGRKDQISQSLQILRKEREKMLVYKTENDKESQALLEQMEAVKEKTRTAFRDLQQCLQLQEKLQLAQMEEVEKEIANRRDEHVARLSGELTSLDSLIQELEEKQQLPENELLQDPGNILERCPKESLEKPVAFPASLKWRIRDFSNVNPFLEGIMNFKESVITGLPFQEAKVTLDPGTAHPRLILSEDRKSVRWNFRCQDLPDNSERFDMKPFVLGCEGFTAGRHYWEVTVGKEGFWAVGVARPSVRRKGDFVLCSKVGIWSMCKWGREHRIFSTLDHPSVPLRQEFKKIRVSLDCAGGQVAFFDADTAVQLHVYSDAALRGETLLPFFSVTAGGHLTLCP